MTENYFLPPHNLSPGPSPQEMTLPSPSWVRLNRLRTGVEYSAQQCTNGAWGPRRTADAEQTPDHILASCPMYHPSNRKLGLAAFDDDTVDWLKTTALNI